MMPGSKKLIGLTGGIGSGKSKVSRYWSSFAGLPLVNIDDVCAQLLEKGDAGWLAVQKEFGDAFFLPDGLLDRQKLRSAIFADEELRLQLNGLIHPLAYARMLENVHRYDSEVVLVDVPLLFEAGWESHFDCRVAVFAYSSTCCRRIIRRDHLEPDEAGRTVCSQLPLVEKVLRADHVINNSGSWAATILDIVHLARLIDSDMKDK